jgi:hypothetical protein
MLNENSSEQIAALKNQVFTLLIALIVVSGTLTVFLYREASTAGKDIAQEQQLAAVMNQNEVAINTFLTKLTAYADKHPEFKPVLAKYGITPAAAAAAAAKH